MRKKCNFSGRKKKRERESYNKSIDRNNKPKKQDKKKH